MTITHFDGLAVLPKRCDCCNRLFIFEMYNKGREWEAVRKFYKTFGTELRRVKYVKCMKCIQKDRKN